MLRRKMDVSSPSNSNPLESRDFAHLHVEFACESVFSSALGEGRIGGVGPLSSCR